jgi:hypothetical protein
LICILSSLPSGAYLIVIIISSVDWAHSMSRGFAPDPLRLGTPETPEDIKYYEIYNESAVWLAAGEERASECGISPEGHPSRSI